MLKNNINMLAAMLDPAFCDDECYAETLVKAAGHFPFKQIEQYLKDQPPSPRVIYLLMVKAQETLQSQNASKRASAPRKQKEKLYARKQWKDWQEEPSRYLNKQKFIEGVVQSNEISHNQARAWFNEFRAEKTSTDWEAAHGKKYPRGKNK